jgi:hypothetical protein
MAHMSNHEYAVEPRLRLILADLSAQVRVRRAGPGTATVELTGGSEDYAAALKVRYDPAENLLDLREDPPQGRVDVTVAGAGNVVGDRGTVVSGGRSGGTTTVATGGAVVSGAPGVTVVNRVVVNGVDVTDQVNAARPEPTEPPVVTVVVPEGTDAGAERCLDLTLDGLRGRVRAMVSGQGRLVAREATAARLTVAGQSRAELHRSGGPVALTVSGQSRGRLDGSFDDVSLELSGQSAVTGSGSYGRVSGHAGGMSRVELFGPVAGETVRTSGMASVRVGGPPPGGAATGDDWDF